MKRACLLIIRNSAVMLLLADCTAQCDEVYAAATAQLALAALVVVTFQISSLLKEEVCD